jgi:chlorinating enzyme
MRLALQPSQVEQYERDGVLFPIPVLSPAEVAAYRSNLEELETLQGGTIKRLDHAHLFFQWAHRLATHNQVVNAVESILGDDILIDATLMLCKYPNDPSYVPWHQDSVYSNWHLSPTTSAWIALTASTPQNGCMRAIVGSHRRGVLGHEVVPDQNNLLRRGERIAIEVDERNAVDLELCPGEMSLHHANIIHSSNPNRTGSKRIGFIVRFVTSRIGRKDPPLMRVRGASVGGELELVGGPVDSDPAEALARLKEFCRQKHQS